MADLTGKICVVTRAARGIGAAIAARFVQDGASVIATDINEELLSQATQFLGCTARRLDVRREEDWADLRSAYPAIDVLVNNAGITGFEESTAPQDPEHASLSDWHAVMATNLDGTFLGCRYAIGAMRAKGTGSIINISSRSGQVGIPRAASYAASKAAIRNHSKSVALYCAEEGLGIRCNSIHPGAILTPMWEGMLGDGPDREDRLQAAVADTPLKRFGTVEEVAAVAAFLASDASAYMTGSELTVDGGLLAGTAAPPSRQ